MSIRITSFLFLILLYSCSVVDGFTTKEFAFVERDRKQKLSLKVPKGFAEEKMILDTTGGKELYYYYSNGSLLYFSKDVRTWTSENQIFIDSLHKRNATGLNNSTYAGKDKDGLYWKEIQMEGFKFGYSYVKTDQLDRFETAINSVRIRH